MLALRADGDEAEEIRHRDPMSHEPIEHGRCGIVGRGDHILDPPRDKLDGNGLVEAVDTADAAVFDICNDMY